MTDLERDALAQRTARIAEQAVDERLRAADLGYGPDHDAAHGYAHTIEWANRYLTHALAGGPELTDVRTDLVKAAGLILASVDIIDNAADDRAGD